MYLMQHANTPSVRKHCTVTPHTYSPSSSERLSNGLKIQGKFGGVGNVHFHNETLRHASGEFTMNRILSTPPRPLSTKRIQISSKNPTKRPLSGLNMTHLITQTQTLLSQQSKPFSTGKSLKKSLKPRNPNYKIKTREYINTYNPV